MPIPASINDLSQTAGSNSPAGSESPSLIDDYLRTYASYIALLRDGAQSNGFNYAAAGGSANAITATYSPAVTTLSDSTVLLVKAVAANTGATTFSPNGLTAKPVVGLGHNALQGGEIVANGDVCLQYNTTIGGGSWVLIYSSGGALQVAPATQSQHAMQLVQATGRLINIAAFTASGTFTPNANTKMLRVRAIGAGGSGGYSLATAAGQTSTGTGGDAGATGEIWVTSGITATAITVGGGGIGAAGGQSTFGALLVCPGGAAGINGGAFPAPGQNVRAGALLQPTGTGIFVFKGAGAGGLNGISLSTSFAQGGNGAVSQYGAGGQGATVGVGGAGIGYGSGGGGAVCLPSTGSQAGGNGAPGLVIIEEYS